MQLQMSDFIKEKHVTLKSNIEIDNIAKKASCIFDYEFSGETVLNIKIPEFPTDFSIGLIVGSSGSGKSTILKQFGEPKEFSWDNSKGIISNFESYEIALDKLGACGLNSVPSWFKPYNVLSNGEKFRVDLALKLNNNNVVDEFTSVVNRSVAISTSISVEKYIRKNNIKNIVFASCHYDIIDYLNPDWIYDTDKQQFISRGLARRPKIELDIISCKKSAWDMFKNHHYLSQDIHNGATCYMALMNDIPVAFASLLSLPGRDVKNAWREHRVCVLPDYQGMGVGNAFSEYLGEEYTKIGRRYFCKTSNPRMGEHRNKSELGDQQ